MTKDTVTTAAPSAATPTQDVGAWPPPSTVVTLRWALATMEVRVLRTSPDDALMAMVTNQRRVSMPDEGAEMSVRWGDGRGLHERPVTLSARRSGLLHVSPAGPVSSTQRRQFFRAPVVIDLTIAAGDQRLEAVSTDLSEGGMRVTVKGVVHLPDEVTAAISLDGDRYELPSTVIRTVPLGGRAEVGLEFNDLPTPAANLIRRQVFTAQVAARRNGQLL